MILVAERREPPVSFVYGNASIARTLPYGSRHSMARVITLHYGQCHWVLAAGSAAMQLGLLPLNSGFRDTQVDADPRSRR